MKNDDFNKLNSVFKVNDIRDRLSDEISRKIFDARFRYLIYRNEKDFLDAINESKRFNIDTFPQIGQAVKELSYVKNLGIYGAGHNGIVTVNTLQRTDNKLNLFFCDSDERKVGTVVWR